MIKFVQAFLEILESNKALEALNLETNFLTGEFLVRLFTAAQQCPTLYEIKCVNQVNLFHILFMNKS